MATERIECQGVVLSETVYGESDRILRLYTERKGKVSVIVKGAKSRRSRFLPLSEVFTFGLYRLSRGRSFYYLNSGKILQTNLGLRSSYDRLIYASAIVEIVDRSSMEGEGTPRIFSLLRKTLHELSTEKEPLPLFLGFVIKYVSFMGYRPLIPIADGEEAYFLPDRGIVEGEYIPGGVAVDPADIYTFRHLLYTSLDKINLDMMEERTLENCYGLLIRYLKVNLDLDKIQSLQLRM
ncbi:DNA repair protein RecO [Aedoeadaptatus nemausensis]|uniref:DNA repair protein RecO n=1 Tax=Aedoeadaptatus nemausensis TaxID=2582829 RepID=A0A6V6XZB1_9FIRM|nr:DNA repair protein RecO [Peptoniphilus nemausensis]CAC9922621.1 DNA repair protein RecO [Peptoniphilus nemausensis]